MSTNRLQKLEFHYTWDTQAHRDGYESRMEQNLIHGKQKK
jgi:hypothetical protein